MYVIRKDWDNDWRALFGRVWNVGTCEAILINPKWTPCLAFFSSVISSVQRDEDKLAFFSVFFFRPLSRHLWNIVIGAAVTQSHKNPEKRIIHAPLQVQTIPLKLRLFYIAETTWVVKLWWTVPESPWSCFVACLF